MAGEVVTLSKTEYDAVVSGSARNQELLDIYLNALRYMVRLYLVADEAWDKEEKTEIALERLLKRFGLSSVMGAEGL